MEWIDNQAVNVVYRPSVGPIAETTLYRDDEHRIAMESRGRRRSFDGDGALLRLVTEANPIKLPTSLIPISPFIPESHGLH